MWNRFSEPQHWSFFSASPCPRRTVHMIYPTGSWTAAPPAPTLWTTGWSGTVRSWSGRASAWAPPPCGNPRVIHSVSATSDHPEWQSREILLHHPPHTQIKFMQTVLCEQFQNLLSIMLWYTVLLIHKVFIFSQGEKMPSFYCTTCMSVPP